MALTVILVLLLLILTYLLLVPLVLYIDTIKNTYFIELKGLAKASVFADKKEVFKIRINVLFMNFYLYPLRRKKTMKKKEELARKSIKKSSKRMNLKVGLRLLRSFKVEKLYMNIDTGDCIYNAKLYPFFALLNYKVGDFRINFEGKNQFILQMQNRPIRLIKSFIIN